MSSTPYKKHTLTPQRIGIACFFVALVISIPSEASLFGTLGKKLFGRGRGEQAARPHTPPQTDNDPVGWWDQAKGKLEDMVQSPEATQAGARGTSKVGPDGVIQYNADNIFEYLGRNLTKRAKNGEYDHHYCPKELMDSIKVKLMSPSLKNVMLTGPAGVGKTATAECFARAIAELSSNTVQELRNHFKQDYRHLLDEVTKAERAFVADEIPRITDEISALRYELDKALKQPTGSHSATGSGSNNVAEIQEQIRKSELRLKELEDHKKLFESDDGAVTYLTEHSEDLLKTWNKYEVMSFDFGDMMGGTAYRGQLEEKMKALRERLERDGNIIPFFDEAHLMAKGAGSTDGGGADIANVLKPMMTEGKVMMIFATTDKEFAKFFSHDQALIRRFHLEKIQEPTAEQVFSILKSKRRSYEASFGVTISDEALQAIIVLAREYSDLAMPGSVFKMMDIAAGSKALVGHSDRYLNQVYETLKRMESQIASGQFDQKRFRELNEQFRRMRAFFTNQRPLSAIIDQKQIKLKSLKEELKNLKVEPSDSEGIARHQNLSKEVKDLDEEIMSLINQRQKIVVEFMDENQDLYTLAQRDEYLSMGRLTRQDAERAIGREFGVSPEFLARSIDEKIDDLAIRVQQSYPSLSAELQHIVRSEARRLRGHIEKKPMLYFSQGNSNALEPLAKILKRSRTGYDKVLEFDLSLPGSSLSELFGFLSSPRSVEPGAIVKAIQRNPHQVIVFKNVEEASDPQVLNVLKQIMNDGKVDIQIYDTPTVINFQHSAFILHSDTFGLNPETLQQVVNLSGQQQTLALSNGLRLQAQELAGGFANRHLESNYRTLSDLTPQSNGTISWARVKTDDLMEVLDAKLRSVTMNLEEKGISMSFDDSAKKLLIANLERNYSGNMEWLPRLFDEMIYDRHIERLFSSGRLVQGQTIQFSARSNGLVVSVKSSVK